MKDIKHYVKSFFETSFIKAMCEHDRNPSAGFEMYFPFEFAGKSCLLAMYSHGGDVKCIRPYWPCLYVETTKTMGDHDYDGWGDTSSIHGGVTWSGRALTKYDDKRRWVGCDFNHYCDLFNTIEEDVENMFESLLGLIKIA